MVSNYTQFVNGVYNSTPERFTIGPVTLDVAKVLGYMALVADGKNLFTSAARYADEAENGATPNFDGAAEYQLAQELISEYRQTQTASIELEDLDYRVLPQLYVAASTKRTLIEGFKIVWTKTPDSASEVRNHLKTLLRKSGYNFEQNDTYDYVTVTFPARGMFAASEIEGLVNEIYSDSINLTFVNA